MIEAFGQFVVAGNYAVGFIVFIILVVINFVVITKGASRIAEVAARFTLDSMPGKQMAIDADLNAGLINEADARQRRQRIQKEGDFYGAMDGASKFVRGDAIAGLIILAVNLLGGFFVGVMQKDMTGGDAARLYSLLSIGDGLVSQVPALIVSTAAGMVVTRSASGGELGVEITKQLLWNPKALYVVAAILALFIVVPGFPCDTVFPCRRRRGRSRLLRRRARPRRTRKSWRLRSNVGGTSPKTRCGRSRWIWSSSRSAMN